MGHSNLAVRFDGAKSGMAQVTRQAASWRLPGGFPAGPGGPNPPRFHLCCSAQKMLDLAI